MDDQSTAFRVVLVGVLTTLHVFWGSTLSAWAQQRFDLRDREPSSFASVPRESPGTAQPRTSAGDAAVLLDDSAPHSPSSQINVADFAWALEQHGGA